MERIPWMLLSGSDLNLFDTYVTMRSLVGTALLRDVSNVEFNIIRENEFYRKAQQKYYLYTMKKKGVTFKEQIKYSYRFFRGGLKSKNAR